MNSSPRLPGTAIGLFGLVVLAAAGGSQCGRRNPAAYTFGPRVLTQTPSLDDVIQTVNRNSALVRSLYTTDATLSLPGAPTLRANLAMERQRRLRIRAETALTGAELDLGSNEESFWMWARRLTPPTLYHCRHDQFATSRAREILPVDPEWLLDAAGLTTFDPAHQHSAPIRNARGHWEIRSTIPGPTGTMTKMTVVDEARGFVLEQHLYDDKGGLVASSLTSRHARDPATGAVVPQVIDIRWPTTQLSLQFDVRQWTVNAIPADPRQLFAMPSHPNWAVIDLAAPGGAGGMPPLGATPPASSGGSSGQLVPVPWDGRGIAAVTARPASPAGDLIGWVPPAAGPPGPAATWSAGAPGSVPPSAAPLPAVRRY